MHSVDDSVYYWMMADYLWTKFVALRNMNEELLRKHRRLHLGMSILQNEAEEAFTRFNARWLSETMTKRISCAR